MGTPTTRSAAPHVGGEGHGTADGNRERSAHHRGGKRGEWGNAELQTLKARVRAAPSGSIQPPPAKSWAGSSHLMAANLHWSRWHRESDAAPRRGSLLFRGAFKERKASKRRKEPCPSPTALLRHLRSEGLPGAGNAVVLEDYCLSSRTCSTVRASGGGRSTGSRAKRPEILLLLPLLQHEPLRSVPDAAEVWGAGNARCLRWAAD